MWDTVNVLLTAILESQEGLKLDDVVNLKQLLRLL